MAADRSINIFLDKGLMNKETRWNRLVRKWALSYIWDLTDEEFQSFMNQVTIRRNLRMTSISVRLPLPKKGLDKIKMFSV